jgi:hypothetical protein
MLKLAAVLMMVTALGNVATPPSNANPNLDAAPPPANAQPYVAQPGPPADATIQHGAVDPRGTDAQPLAVRIVNPPAAQSGAGTDALVQQLQAGQDGMRLLAWIAVIFLALQTLMFAAGLYFIVRLSNEKKRMQRAEPSV